MNRTTTIARLERGVMRRSHPAAVVLAHAMIHQRWGEPELHELHRLVRPGTVAVDAGAHFGVYSLALARLVGKRGRVISIEPIEEDAAMLRRAMRALRMPVSVVTCALSAQPGEATLRVPLLGGAQKTALATLQPAAQVSEASGVEERTVRVRTLDEILADVDMPVSFIKIDVEGHELDVLAGAEETLRQHRPNLLIEINEDLRDGSMCDAFVRIEAYGYRGEFLEEGRFRRPLSAFDPDRHQRRVTNPLSRSYINNFIFLPEDRFSTVPSS
ncbi:MAG TPA: FkbM family methyltransferase [Thermomicrobiales bacterium]|nr:FkbM family methyltransferase [Thermomicrobiales bacterium]